MKIFDDITSGLSCCNCHQLYNLCCSHHQSSHSQTENKVIKEVRIEQVSLQAITNLCLAFGALACKRLENFYLSSHDSFIVNVVFFDRESRLHSPSGKYNCKDDGTVVVIPESVFCFRCWNARNDEGWKRFARDNDLLSVHAQ